MLTVKKEKVNCKERKMLTVKKENVNCKERKC